MPPSAASHRGPRLDWPRPACSLDSSHYAGQDTLVRGVSSVSGTCHLRCECIWIVGHREGLRVPLVADEKLAMCVERCGRIGIGPEPRVNYIGISAVWTRCDRDNPWYLYVWAGKDFLCPK